MPAWFTRVGDSFVPMDEEALTATRKVKEGKPTLLHIDRVRSPEWHRLYFKRCAVIAENTGISTDAIDAKTRMMAGHVELAGEWNGKPLYVPARIAFDKLSASGWEDIWLGLELAHEQLLPGITAEISGHANL